MKNNEQKDLFDTLIEYVIPIFNKDNSKNKKKQGKLEDLVEKDKVKLKPLQLIFLEDLVSSFLKNNKKIKVKTSQKIDLFEENKENDQKNNDEEIRYSIALQRKKEETDKFGYRVEIKYEETEVEEKLNVKITFQDPLENDSLNQKTIDKKEYSINLTKEKEIKTKTNYSVNLVYENSYEEERLSINYRSTTEAYLNKRQEALHDFSDRVPGKHVDILPANMMPGVLGFTYLGQDRMTLRDDLIGDKQMVDIHESIHTPDEYETRILTTWIMTKERTRYIR